MNLFTEITISPVRRAALRYFKKLDRTLSSTERHEIIMTLINEMQRFPDLFNEICVLWRKYLTYLISQIKLAPSAITNSSITGTHGAAAPQQPTERDRISLSEMTTSRIHLEESLNHYNNAQRERKEADKPRKIRRV